MQPPASDGDDRAMPAANRVAIVAFAEVQSLDVTGPIEVFHGASQLLQRSGARGYEIGIATIDGNPIRCSSGITLGATWALADLSHVHTLLIAGGTGTDLAASDPTLIAEIRRLADLAGRVGSICTGAFVLAAAGLLHERRATTHWASVQRLAERHPTIVVEPDSIFTRDGDIWTSAGVTAGIDLALAMVADDHDDETARRIAQWLVMYLRRSGGQSQFSTPLNLASARRDEIRRTQEWIATDPSRDCSVMRLAEHARMSPRNFARVFRSEVGVTPARYVESCRMDVARSLLETSGLTIAEIARRTGVGDAATLHRLFERRLATTPDAYRRHFSRERSSP